MNYVKILSTAIAVTPAIYGQTLPGETAAAGGNASTVVTCGRQSFSLAHHDADARVETDEYRLTSEMSDSWTQLLTVQRLKPERSATVGQLVEFLRANREAAGWDPIAVQAQGARACVFEAAIAPREGAPALRVVGLVVDESERASAPSLVVIHFTARAGMEGNGETEESFSDWRGRFLRQAARANNKAGGAAQG